MLRIVIYVAWTFALVSAHAPGTPSLKPCPGRTHTCVIDPCSLVSCPKYPTASCRNYRCGDICTAEYWYHGQEVTTFCGGDQTGTGSAHKLIDAIFGSDPNAHLHLTPNLDHPHLTYDPMLTTGPAPGPAPAPPPGPAASPDLNYGSAASHNPGPAPSLNVGPALDLGLGPAPSPGPAPPLNLNPSPIPTAGTFPSPSANPYPNPSPNTFPNPSPNTFPNPSPNTFPNPSPNPNPNPSPNTFPSPSPNTFTNPSSNTFPNPSPNTFPNPSPNTFPNPSPNTFSNPSPNTFSNPSPNPNPNPSPNPNPNPTPSLDLNLNANPNPPPNPFPAPTPLPAQNVNLNPGPSTGFNPSPNLPPAPGAVPGMTPGLNTLSMGSVGGAGTSANSVSRGAPALPSNSNGMLNGLVAELQAPSPAMGPACPAGQQRMNCVPRPCEVVKCPGSPTASCRDNYCGICSAQFFQGQMEVTSRCYASTAPALPAQPPQTAQVADFTGAELKILNALLQPTPQPAPHAYKPPANAYTVPSRATNLNALRANLGNIAGATPYQPNPNAVNVNNLAARLSPQQQQQLLQQANTLARLARTQAYRPPTNKLLGKCPMFTAIKQCNRSPCLITSCPAVPQAECQDYNCGRCTAKFFFRGKEVTSLCTGRPARTNNRPAGTRSSRRQRGRVNPMWFMFDGMM